MHALYLALAFVARLASTITKMPNKVVDGIAFYGIS